METWYEVRLESDTLRLHHLRLAPITLTHRDGDEFTGGSSFFGTVKFVRAGNGTITGFMVSNGRTRNVWFRRQ